MRLLRRYGGGWPHFLAALPAKMPPALAPGAPSQLGCLVYSSVCGRSVERGA